MKDLKFELAWKTELQSLASKSATRSWIVAAIIAPFYMFFEVDGSKEHFLHIMIFTLSVSGFLLLVTYLKTRITFSEFITTYGVSIIISGCTVVMCAITEAQNVQYYLLIVSIISMSKGVLYTIDVRNLFKLSLFNHLLAYCVIAVFRDEAILEIPDILTTIFYQFILLLFSFTGAHMRYSLERENFIKGLKIEQAQKRADALLFNILPEQVAEELKEKGYSDAQLIEQVTVLFTDFKGFTELSEQLSPKELVADLHACFSEFDNICELYNLEKIKTIGDGYMAAGGLPLPNSTHAHDVVKAALEMLDVIDKIKAYKATENLPYFELRVGVNTGPVVAGIVGVKKFQYDIWGDTVNTASRIESHGEAGKVNISQATYELLKDDTQFAFESRGKIEAKGKGAVKMYFVSLKA